MQVHHKNLPLHIEQLSSQAMISDSDSSYSVPVAIKTADSTVSTAVTAQQAPHSPCVRTSETAPVSLSKGIIKKENVNDEYVLERGKGTRVVTS
jgi:hypothetical protein